MTFNVLLNIQPPTSQLGQGKNEHRWLLPVYIEVTSKSWHPPPALIPTSCNLCSGYHSVRLCFFGRSWCWADEVCTEVKKREQVGDFNPHDHCSFFPNVSCSRHKDRGTKPLSHDLHYSVSIQRARTGRSSTNEKRLVPFTYSYRSSTPRPQVLCFCPPLNMNWVNPLDLP